MKKNIYRLIVLSVAFGCFVGNAWSEISMLDVYPVDVTPSGFSVIWRTSQSAAPGIAVYADSNGQTDITDQFEVTHFPLAGGNPSLQGEYEQDLYLQNVRYWMASRGLMNIRVQGLAPATTYYYKVFASSYGQNASWPVQETASITTPGETAFVSEAGQILLTVDSANAQGYMVMAKVGDAPYGVCARVGDGAPAGKAIVNLANLYTAAGSSWQPQGVQEIQLSIYGKWGYFLTQTVNVTFSGEFKVAAFPENAAFTFNYPGLTGDLNDDGFLDLRDAVQAMQFMSHFNLASKLFLSGDTNQDNQIGMADTLYVLQSVSGIRSGAAP